MRTAESALPVASGNAPTEAAAFAIAGAFGAVPQAVFVASRSPDESKTDKLGCASRLPASPYWERAGPSARRSTCSCVFADPETTKPSISTLEPGPTMLRPDTFVSRSEPPTGELHGLPG